MEEIDLDNLDLNELLLDGDEEDDDEDVADNFQSGSFFESSENHSVIKCA